MCTWLVAFVGVADTGWPVMTDEADTVGQPVADTPRGDEHVGFGRVGAVVASVPDRVALLVLCGSLVVTAMLQFKVFNPYAAVVATVIAFAGTWRVLPTRDNPTDQRSVLGVVVAVEVVAAWVWVNAPYYAQELSVYRDPAIYALRGWWLTQHSSPVIGMSVAMTGAAGRCAAPVPAPGRRSDAVPPGGNPAGRSVAFLLHCAT